MSRSNKARYGTRCKTWKDTVLASRSQKRAWSKTKQLKRQEQRAGDKASTRHEVREEQKP